MKYFSSLLIIVAFALISLSNGEEEKLKIGVKKRVENCTTKTRVKKNALFFVKFINFLNILFVSERRSRSHALHSNLFKIFK